MLRIITVAEQHPRQPHSATSPDRIGPSLLPDEVDFREHWRLCMVVLAG